MARLSRCSVNERVVKVIVEVGGRGRADLGEADGEVVEVQCE